MVNEVQSQAADPETVWNGSGADPRHAFLKMCRSVSPTAGALHQLLRLRLSKQSGLYPRQQLIGFVEDTERTIIPSYRVLNGWPTAIVPVVGAPFAIGLPWVNGLPAHAVASFAVIGLATGLGVTAGLHRLFTHRSFATFRSVEWVLMVLGCMAGQSSPFLWVANHRMHHQNSDDEGDPHSPHLLKNARRLGSLRGFWHAHMGWLCGYASGYSSALVKDLTRRPLAASVFVGSCGSCRCRRHRRRHSLRCTDRVPVGWPAPPFRCPPCDVCSKLRDAPLGNPGVRNTGPEPEQSSNWSVSVR